MTALIQKLWYSNHPLRWLLWPFSQIYKIFIVSRRYFLVHFKQQHFSAPIIVVGNLTVGGAGKTPLVIALAQRFQAQGLRVGIVSRGYGARIKKFPYQVRALDTAKLVGDEPLLIAQKTTCPVVIAPKRVEAVRYLLRNHTSQIIISDDGLQHYKMGRAIEIVVMDGMRQLGNGLCLPAGPLREAPRRLRQCDFIVNNGGLPASNAYLMQLIPQKLRHLRSERSVELSELAGRSIAAVAGIGHPERFFNTLRSLGLDFTKYSFPDHHDFTLKNLQFTEEVIVMTEKDAVKCKAFATEAWFFLPIEATLPTKFWQELWTHKQLQGRI